MGLFKAVIDAGRGVLGDQWKEYFYCDALSNDVLMVKGERRATEGKDNNRKGNDNIISNGSVVAVNEGQCMIIVDQGKVVELCAEAGEFVYDTSSEPSIFAGNIGESVVKSFVTFGKRFTMGGNTGKDQRVYFFNTKEIMSNLFGTANPVPFRVVDSNIGLDVDISIKCNGEYSYKIVDPILFYTHVCGNVTDSFNRSEVASQLKAELMTALQPAFAQISAMGVRYSAIAAHTEELTKALNVVLSDKWAQLRGIEMVSMAINSMKASEDDENMIKELQKTAVYRQTDMAAANLSLAQAEAMKSAASNTATGPMFAFAGMNMAQNVGGMNAASLFEMSKQGGQQTAPGMQQSSQNVQAAPAAAPAPVAAAPVLGWTCDCGNPDNRGKFCMECGKPKPQDAGWTCGCGTVNQGKFCVECGLKKPEGAPLFKCDKCGWEPEDPSNPPKFCPECGDTFDENDKR